MYDETIQNNEQLISSWKIDTHKQNQNSQIYYVGGHVNCKLSYFYTFCMAGPA